VPWACSAWMGGPLNGYKQHPYTVPLNALIYSLHVLLTVLRCVIFLSSA